MEFENDGDTGVEAVAFQSGDQKSYWGSDISFG